MCLLKVISLSRRFIRYIIPWVVDYFVRLNFYKRVLIVYSSLILQYCSHLTNVVILKNFNVRYKRGSFLKMQVAQEDQKTFTDLVRQLVGQCGSDVEKARTIFRWITVKNLNSMNFDETAHGDTPMALLRGIKYGTESYHVLFKRLCRYFNYFYLYF